MTTENKAPPAKTAAQILEQAIFYVGQIERTKQDGQAALLSVLVCWLLQANLIARNDEGFTAATDGVRVWINEYLASDLSVADRCFLLCHEAMHSVLRHIPQLKMVFGEVNNITSRASRRSNIAQDMWINYVLGEIFGSPEHRHKVTLKGQEFGVYIDSINPQTKKPMVRDHHEFNPDEHDWYEILRRLDDDAGSDGGGGFGEGSDLEQGDASTDAEAEVVAGRAVSQGTARCTKNRAHGTAGGWLERLLGAMAQPRHDWKAELWDAVQGSIPADYSYKKLNKTYANMGACVGTISRPGIGSLVVAMDTSGSISEEMLMQPIAEVDAIRRDTMPQKVYQLWIDADIANVQIMEPDDPLDPKPAGGGGTDFRPAFEWANTEPEETIEMLIYFTDGYGRFPDEAPDYPVIWFVLPGGLESSQFPFGKVIRMKED